jgi:hypothetical protein
VLRLVDRKGRREWPLGVLERASAECTKPRPGKNPNERTPAFESLEMILNGAKSSRDEGASRG